MRFGIFDDEDMEPITVVNLPGFTDQQILRMNGRLMLVPPVRPLLAMHDCPPPLAYEKLEYVEIRFEQFQRNGVRHWFAFTRQAALAMLLDPAWLPGQLGAVQRIEQDRDALANLLMHALRS